MFLQILQNLLENNCVRVSFKKRLWKRCFPVKFAKFMGTTFLQNTSGRLDLFRVNRASDNYAKCLYIKVVLWIIVLRMLVPSKILRISKILKTLANLFEYTYNKSGVGLQPWTLLVISFSRIFFYFRNIYFQKHLRVLFNFFDCNVTRIFSLLFLQKIRRPVLFSHKLITLNNNW